MRTMCPSTSFCYLSHLDGIHVIPEGAWPFTSLDSFPNGSTDKEAVYLYTRDKIEIRIETKQQALLTLELPVSSLSYGCERSGE